MYQQLSLAHPRVYRQVLYLVLAAVLLSGMVNAIAPWVARIQFENAPTLAMASPAAAPSAHAGATAQVQAASAELPASLPAYRYDAASASPVEVARKLNAAWFGDQYWPALQAIWVRESGFNPNSHNRSSGACGIPQALPCSKISDHTTAGQIVWGLGYIQGRYGNPANAWRFWQLHHWY